MKYVFLLLALLVMLAAPGVAVLAQSDEPPALPPGFDIPTPDQIAGPVIYTVIATIVSLVSSPVTAGLVSILKTIIARLPDNQLFHRLKLADATALSVAVALALFGTSWVFWALGRQDTFTGFILFVLNLLPAFTAVQINPKAASVVYDHAIKGHSLLAKRQTVRRAA